MGDKTGVYSYDRKRNEKMDCIKASIRNLRKGYLVQREKPEEGRRALRSKYCDYKNQCEHDDPNSKEYNKQNNSIDY